MESYDLNKLTRLKALKQFGEKIQSIYATREDLDGKADTTYVEELAEKIENLVSGSGIDFVSDDDVNNALREIFGSENLAENSSVGSGSFGGDGIFASDEEVDAILNRIFGL